MSGRPASLLAVLLALASPVAAGDTLTVACAANFTDTLRRLAGPFRESEGADLRIVSGSTGQLYAQIVQGAPYDLFLAADRRRPRLLVEAGHAVPGTRRTYAVGRLVLWSREPGRVDGPAALRRGDFRRLAMADPELAPYGLAARQTLQSLGLWNDVRERLALGQNIAQAFQFTASGNAELGLVARAQVVRHAGGPGWLVPAHLHDAIRQDAVMIRDERAARRFLDFLGSAPARRVIAAAGYDPVADESGGAR